MKTAELSQSNLQQGIITYKSGTTQTALKYSKQLTSDFGSTGMRKINFYKFSEWGFKSTRVNQDKMIEFFSVIDKTKCKKLQFSQYRDPLLKWSKLLSPCFLHLTKLIFIECSITNMQFTSLLNAPILEEIQMESTQIFNIKSLNKFLSHNLEKVEFRKIPLQEIDLNRIHTEKTIHRFVYSPHRMKSDFSILAKAQFSKIQSHYIVRQFLRYEVQVGFTVMNSIKEKFQHQPIN